MKSIAILLGGTIIMLPIFLGICSNSIIVNFFSIVYCVWLWFQSRTRRGKWFLRRFMRIMISAEKSLGVW